MHQHTLAVVGAPQPMGPQPWGNTQSSTAHFLFCFAIGHQTCGQGPRASAQQPAVGLANCARASAPFWHGGRAHPICPFAIPLANAPPYRVGPPGATAHWGFGCRLWLRGRALGVPPNAACPPCTVAFGWGGKALGPFNIVWLDKYWACTQHCHGGAPWPVGCGMG